MTGHKGLGAAVLLVALLASGVSWLRQRTPPAALDVAKGETAFAAVRAAAAVRADSLPGSSDEERHVVQLSGYVRSTEGRAIPRASVCSARVSEPCCAPGACVQTDDAGRFELEASAAGNSLLIA